MSKTHHESWYQAEAEWKSAGPLPSRASGETMLSVSSLKAKGIEKFYLKGIGFFFLGFCVGLLVQLLLPVYGPSADCWRKHSSPVQVKAT